MKKKTKDIKSKKIRKGVVRISPTKLNLVASLIRRKRIVDAVKTLSFVPNKAAFILKKICVGFINDITKSEENYNDFFIYKLEVNKGLILKRSMPRAKGVMNIERRRYSVLNMCVAKEKEIYPSGLRG